MSDGGQRRMTRAAASHAGARPRQVTAGRGKCASDGRLRGVTRAAASLNDVKLASYSGSS